MDEGGRRCVPGIPVPLTVTLPTRHALGFDRVIEQHTILTYQVCKLVALIIYPIILWCFVDNIIFYIYDTYIFLKLSFFIFSQTTMIMYDYIDHYFAVQVLLVYVPPI